MIPRTIVPIVRAVSVSVLRLLVLVGLVTATATPAPNTADHRAPVVLENAGAVTATSGSLGPEEERFTQLLNELRASEGLPALAVDVRLVDLARAWTGEMAATNVLAHNPGLRDQAPPEWVRLGENVGVGSTFEGLHRALVNSPGHYANLVNKSFNYVGIGVVRTDRLWVTQVFMQAPRGVVIQSSAEAAAPTDGYRILTTSGDVYDFATRAVLGGVPGGARIVGGVATPTRSGYWAVAEDGTVHARGDAPYLGGLNGTPLSAPIVGMAATPTGQGYWLLGRDGGVFSFGDAGFFGSTGGIRLNQPVVGMSASPSGAGYWFVAADGGIFSFGDAAFHGSTGDIRLNQPIRGMTTTPSGRGYWLVARDGGIFSFGDAGFFGSTGDVRLNQPIVGMAPSLSGQGYRFVAADGGVFAFGDAAFAGSGGGLGLGSSVVALIAG